MTAPGVVEETDGETWFRIIYTMPKQTLLLEDLDLDKAVGDECVERAMKRDFMPVGAPYVHDPVDAAPDVGAVEIKLEEGSRMNPQAFMEGLGMQNSVSVDMCSITAEVAIGYVGRARDGG